MPVSIRRTSRRIEHLNRLDRPEQALADLQQALALDPSDDYAWNTRGVAHNKLNQPERALADYSKAIELDPRNANRWTNRGNTFTRLNRHEEAIADYTKAIELAPNNVAALNNFAELLASCPNVTLRDPRRAVELATKAVQLRTSDGDYWMTLSAAHYRAQDWSAAIAALEKSMELRDGGDATERMYLAMSHWKLGHHDQAVAEYEAAVQWLQRNMEKIEADMRYMEQLLVLQKEAADLLGQSPCD